MRDLCEGEPVSLILPWEERRERRRRVVEWIALVVLMLALIVSLVQCEETPPPAYARRVTEGVR